MSAILIIALISARNAQNNNQYEAPRPRVVRNSGNRNVEARRAFRVRNERRGLGGRFQRY